MRLTQIAYKNVNDIVRSDPNTLRYTSIDAFAYVT